MSDLRQKKCQACEGGIPALLPEQIAILHPQLHPRWRVEQQKLIADFSFRNYWQTSAFVNAVVWIAHQEDHHPDIRFGYQTAQIQYQTHAVNNLTENDFICAAKIDGIIDGV